VKADPMTVRGTSWGSRVVVKNKEPCVVFVGSRLDLVWTCQTHGFYPSHIHVRNCTLLDLVRRLVPTANISCTAHPGWVAGLPVVAFVQGRAGTFSFLFPLCEFILATQA
jgi:hypothetical protein